MKGGGSVLSGLNTLCRGCSSHTILVGLLYPGGNKSEKVAPVTKFSQLRA